jgi:hypothetical protein
MENPSKKHFADCDMPFDTRTAVNGTRRALARTTSLQTGGVGANPCGNETFGPRLSGPAHP